MNKRIKFFHSIHFKIAFVFVLMLLMTLEVVGSVFVSRLEKRNITNFEKQVQLPMYVSNSLTSQLTQKNTQKANKAIRSLLSDVDTTNSTQVQVIGSDGTIRGTNQVSNQTIVGQKTLNRDVKESIYNSKIINNTYRSTDGERYYTFVKPLIKSSNNEVVGVAYIHANLASVYQTLNSTTLIFLIASLIAILLGVLMSIVISRAITRPIDDMKKQTLKIARGDYSGRVRVYGQDELGQLAQAVNNLSVRVEDSQETTESERRRLDSVLSNMTDGVLATNRKGNIIIANYEAENFLNKSENDLIGKSILDILGIQKKHALRDLIENPDEMKINLSTDEDTLIVRAHFSLIQRESGFISGLVCVLSDVTEQQKIDNDRKQFVSNVSHELRTPLTSVHSYLETLIDGAWQEKEVAPEFLKVAQDETNRMVRMINDLLTLSRIDSGTQKLNMELVNINELFSYILNQFDMILKTGDKTEAKMDTKNNDYKIVRHFTNRDLWAEIDTDKFTQVIDNLINNAMKYSPEGGKITCSLYDTNNKIILSISDQGLGIPQSAIPHIFDRFYRVDKARSRAQGGSGLGLSISKDVIESLNGKIWAESKEGKGSTFYISLPYEPIEEDLWDEN